MVSLDERLEGLLKASQGLDAECETLNSRIERVADSLAKAKVSVEARLKISERESTIYSTDSEEETPGITRTWLSYERDDDGNFGIFAQEHIFYANSGQLAFKGDLKPLLKCPRDTRIDGLAELPNLLEALESRTREKIAKIASAKDAVAK